MSSMLLDVPAERSPLTAARWFGAMQSQDVASGHWSLGSRGTGLTQADVIDAFERAGLGLTPRDADTAVDALAPARCATWRRMHRSLARDRPDIRRRRGLGTQSSEDASRPSPRRVVISVCAQPRTRVPSGLRGLVGPHPDRRQAGSGWQRRVTRAALVRCGGDVGDGGTRRTTSPGRGLRP
jgi:hypothetical protein